MNDRKRTAGGYSDSKQALTNGRKNWGFERLAEGDFERGSGEDVSVRFEPVIAFHTLPKSNFFAKLKRASRLRHSERPKQNGTQTRIDSNLRVRSGTGRIIVGAENVDRALVPKNSPDPVL
jgi:hypothetical protein